MDITVHDCTALAVQMTFPSNGNCIRLRLTSKGGSDEITLYNLPPILTDVLLVALPHTDDCVRYPIDPPSF